MKHIFMDTNVVIDFLANRQPFMMDAAHLFKFSRDKKVKLYISAASYGTIYYILRRSLAQETTINLLERVTAMTEIADVTSEIIRQSLKSDFKDYEDAIQYYCAISLPQIDFIVTRDLKISKRVRYLY